jgi:hypothetical protein
MVSPLQGRLIRGGIRRGDGIGEAGRGGEGGGIVRDFVPVLEFVVERELLLHVGEGSEQDLAEEGEDGGFAKGIRFCAMAMKSLPRTWLMPVAVRKSPLREAEISSPSCWDSRR